ncbi:MAG: hypothetical protein ACYTHN_22755, partial [Planctomycetota bacterium]
MKVFLFLCAVAVLCVGGAEWADAGEDKADLIWVIDASVSAGRGDRGANARSLVSGFTALMAPRLSRVAVLKYGGWAESLQEGLSILPAREVPGDLQGRRAFLADLDAALKEKLPFEFTGSDLNAPFEQEGGVLAFLKARDEEGRNDPVLVVVLSAGGFQAVETIIDDGQTKVVARKIYEDDAQKESGDANRDSINAEARRCFREKVMPVFQAFTGVSLLPLHSGKPEGKTESAFDAPLVLAEIGLADLLAAWQKALPKGHGSRNVMTPHGMEGETVDPGKSMERDFRVVQGTEVLNLVVFGPPALEIQLTGPDGSPP